MMIEFAGFPGATAFITAVWIAMDRQAGPACQGFFYESMGIHDGQET